MRGFTLLEFLVATTFFLIILVVGYETLWAQKDLITFTKSSVRPEMESNYRILLLKHLVENSSEPFKLDPMLETTPTFFTDLNFGLSPRTDAFSIVTATGSPARFEREEDVYRSSAVTSLKVGDLLLLGGVNTRQKFAWSYARVTKVNADRIELGFLIPGEALEKGALIKVQVNGFLFKQGTLYWISPGGQAAPFLGSLDDFRYSWSPPELTIFWRMGRMEFEFGSVL